MMDHYETLGVPESASAEEIKRAYRNIAQDTHPDRLPRGIPERLRSLAVSDFRNATEAYDVLSDQDKRADYDRARGEGREVERLLAELRGYFDNDDMMSALRVAKELYVLVPDSSVFQEMYLRGLLTLSEERLRRGERKEALEALQIALAISLNPDVRERLQAELESLDELRTRLREVPGRRLRGQTATTRAPGASAQSQGATGAKHSEVQAVEAAKVGLGIVGGFLVATLTLGVIAALVSSVIGIPIAIVIAIVIGGKYVKALFKDGL